MNFLTFSNKLACIVIKSKPEGFDIKIHFFKHIKLLLKVAYLFSRSFSSDTHQEKTSRLKESN